MKRQACNIFYRQIIYEYSNLIIIIRSLARVTVMILAQYLQESSLWCKMFVAHTRTAC